MCCGNALPIAIVDYNVFGEESGAILGDDFICAR